MISLVLGYLSGLKDEANVNSLVQDTNPDQILEEISELSRFQLVKGKFAWQAAKVDAEARGGHLATITNSKEDELIENLLLSDKGYYWLGGTDTKNEGIWTWITGEPWGYTRWLKTSTHSEPDNGGGQGEDYLVCKGGYANGYMWADTDIHDMRFTNVGYILEVPFKKQKQELNKEPDFLKEGLVAYYPFNGNPKDESGNENDGEVFGPVLVSDRNQHADSAYNFDGINDYIDVGNIIKKLDDVTFSVWFLQTKKSVVRSMNLVQKRRSPTGGGVALNSSKGVVSGGNRSNFGVKNPLRTDDEKWHHAVYSLGKKKMELFVDGVSVDVLGVETGEAFSNENIWIGRGYTHDVDTGGNRAFKGFIDDVRIYNRALSAEEVKALYEFEKAH